MRTKKKKCIPSYERYIFPINSKKLNDIERTLSSLHFYFFYKWNLILLDLSNTTKTTSSSGLCSFEKSIKYKFFIFFIPLVSHIRRDVKYASFVYSAHCFSGSSAFGFSFSIYFISFANPPLLLLLLPLRVGLYGFHDKVPAYFFIGLII